MPVGEFLDAGQSFQVVAMVNQPVVAALEGLFHDNAHADYFSAGLFSQGDQALGCFAVGQEVIDD